MVTAVGLEVIVNGWTVWFIDHGFHEYGTIDNELIWLAIYLSSAMRHLKGRSESI
jgi:hypothetical protein